MIDVASLVSMALMGFLGGVTYCLVTAKSWRQFKEFRYSRRMMLGLIIGIVYCFLHSDYNFPNTIMAFVSGYMGTDFVSAIIEKLSKKG